MESRGLSASTKIPSKNLCFGIELEVIVKLPASYKPKTGKTATGKPVPSTWYQAGRYILGTHRKWIKTKFVGEPITVIRSVDKRFWPIHPGEKDFHGEDAARDLDAWKDLLKEDPTLVDSDTRENWEDPKNSDSLDFHAWTLVADGTIGRPEDGCTLTKSAIPALMNH
jgi:hypothetical protein